MKFLLTYALAVVLVYAGCWQAFQRHMWLGIFLAGTGVWTAQLAGGWKKR